MSGQIHAPATLPQEKMSPGTQSRSGHSDDEEIKIPSLPGIESRSSSSYFEFIQRQVRTVCRWRKKVGISFTVRLVSREETS